MFIIFFFLEKKNPVKSFRITFYKKKRIFSIAYMSIFPIWIPLELFFVPLINSVE